MYPNLVIFVVLSVLCEDAFARARLDPLVQSNVGLIRGLEANDGDYSMFLGIPYAQVNKTNPFGAAAPYTKFDGIFAATDDSTKCPQVDDITKTIVGTLDCLHLNVFVPRTATSRNRLPVMVWIHGGRYSTGSIDRYLYGPKYLVRHNVILVTLNYRLGPYGFMCLDTPEVPGNQGLKDQFLALRWVKDNIASFGGDINKITLFGESSGSMSVDLHLYSEQEKLFNRVLMESGSSMQIESLQDADRTAPVKLANAIGFLTADFNEALTFISTVDPKLIIAASSAAGKFLPCPEKEFENVDRFVTDFSINKNVPKAENMQILTGYNSNEWIASYINADQEFFAKNNDFYDRLKEQFDFDEKKLLEMEKIVRNFYIGDEKITENVKFQLADFSSNVKFNHPAERSIAKYLKNGADKVFYYVFSYNGGRNFLQRQHNFTAEGAAHADELGYLFDSGFLTEEPSPEDQLTLDRMTTMWTNFAKYGDPTPETSEILPVKWEPITEDSVFNYLDIDTEISLGTKPDYQRLSFWDLFFKTNEKFQRGYKDNNNT